MKVYCITKWMCKGKIWLVDRPNLYSYLKSALVYILYDSIYLGVRLQGQ